MSYFRHLPKFDYRFGNKTIEISDIFRRIAFTEKTRKNPNNWSSYSMKSTDTFDQVSYEYYSNPEYYWQIMMMNNIVTRTDSPANYIEVEKEYTKFDNQYAFLTKTYYEIQPDPGDFLVSFSESGEVESWALLESYDPVNRTMLSRLSSNINWTTPKSVDHLSSNGTVLQTIELSRIVRYGLSPSYYYTTDGKISPYYVPSTNTFIDPFTEDLDSTDCLLEAYINGALPNGYFVKSIAQNYIEELSEKRQIKVPPSSTVTDVSRATEEILNNGNAEDIINVKGAVFVGNTTSQTIQ